MKQQTIAKMFDTLMTGLDEVEAFLVGETASCKVNLPAPLPAVPQPKPDDIT